MKTLPHYFRQIIAKARPAVARAVQEMARPRPWSQAIWPCSPVRTALRLAILPLLLGAVPGWAVPHIDIGQAMEEVDRLLEEGQLWLVPDVLKEMKPDYFARLEKEAAAGTVKAQATLGLCYHGGYGVTRDYAKAAEWYEKAAKAGHAGAQNNLAQLYDYGMGMPVDHMKAHDLYLAAARQNLKDAQYNVAVEYARGIGVPQAWQEARRWCEKAAAQGHLLAMANLGYIYLAGRGVPVNLETARQYLQKPAEADIAAAQYTLALCCMAQKNLAEAVPWLRRSAEGGCPAAQFMWGSYLSDSDNVQADLPKAIFWARKALAGLTQANSRLVPEVHAELARMFLVQGTDASKVEAFREACAAAQAGNGPGQNLVGICYHRGAGVPADLATAVKWYRVAAENKNPTAAGNLGALYFAGHGVPKDYAEAIKWDRIAAAAGIATAQYRLGLCYRDGTGVDIDQQEALKWLRLAAQGLPKDRAVISALTQLEGQLNHAAAETSYQKAVALAQAAKGNAGSTAEVMTALTEAANHGQPLAIAALARMYRIGEGVAMDEAKADALVARIEQTSNPAVLYQIGVSFLPNEHAQPAEKNADRAIGFFLRSVQEGDGRALGPLGFSYMAASAEHRDLVSAFQWLTLAAAQGDEDARMYLERLRPRLTNEQTAEALRRLSEMHARMQPASLACASAGSPPGAAGTAPAPVPAASR